MSIRRRPKLGARAPLQILLGNVPDAIDYIFESTDDSLKQLSALGVEREESNEHHLQAALSHTNVIHNRETRPSSPSFARAAAKPATQPLPAYFIPTPDANGQADDYESLLPANRMTWNDPRELIKFSEKVEECSYGWGGLNYEMDDADVAWVSEFNAKEEGSSTDASQGRPHRGKGKEKEKEGAGPLRIPDDVFEYVMGMFELWTERHVPMLHTDLSLLPAFGTIEPIFKSTPPASYFPSFEQPRNLPHPTLLIKIASRAYPHWKLRKEQRKGKSITPQLNFDEANESDPYLCFRRRDLKVQRKTRIKDMTPVNRLEQVQTELNSAVLLVNMVLMREREKQKTLKSEKDLWETRWNLLETKRKVSSLAVSPEEENLLFPHRALSTNGQSTVKRQRVMEKDREHREREEAARVAQMHLAQKGMRSRAVSPVADRVPPEQLAGMLAEKVEKEMSRRKEMDRLAEDTMGVTYQPLPQPAPIKYFRCLPASDSHTPSLRSHSVPASDDETETSLKDSFSSRPNHQMCFRLRRGRGGITRLDRKMPSVRHIARTTARSAASEDPYKVLFPTNPLARRLLGEGDQDEGDRQNREREEDERARHLSERWRYDWDGGLVGVGMGVKDEDQVVIDDFETRYIKARAALIKQDDLDLMMPSMSIIDKVRNILAQPEDKPAPITFSRTVPPQMPQPVQGMPKPQGMQIPFQSTQADAAQAIYAQQQQAQQLLQQHAQVQAAQAQAAHALSQGQQNAPVNGARQFSRPLLSANFPALPHSPDVHSLNRISYRDPEFGIVRVNNNLVKS